MRAAPLVLLLLAAAAAADPAPEARRRLARTLVSREAARRERSLRDALAPRRAPSAPAAPPDDPVVIRTWSELFAWGINSTVRHSELSVPRNFSARTRRPLVVPHGHPPPARVPAPPMPHVAAKPSAYGLAPVARRERVARTPPAERTLPAEREARPARTPYVALENLGLDEDETGVMLRALAVLQAAHVDDVGARVGALHILQELCHGHDNARDLHAAGGLAVVVGGLVAEDAAVRASAAWALGTCSQNNPTVQNESYTLGAVPVLMRMAAEDVPNVCSRALLALNALVELNAARALFETLVSESSHGIEALRRPLLEQPDTRATRRALNLAELLAERNLDAWKTYIEAWDLGPVIEDIMRRHHDPDVRESAARLITVLDGRDPAEEE